MNIMRSIFVRGGSRRRLCNDAGTTGWVEAARFLIATRGNGGARSGPSWLVGLALVSALLLGMVEPVAAQSYQIFVPLVSSDAPGGLGERASECNLNEQEAAIAQLMLNDPGEQRDSPVCDPILAQVARARARDMALRAYFSHTNPDGDGPNKLVREAGYPLPDWYGDAQNANNVESIGGGYQSADAEWQGWLNSPVHRTHVLGTKQFYADQDSYGIGYYFNPDAPFKYYWVFISAPTAKQ